MSIPKDVEDMNRGLGPWSILSAYRGSIAHGMYIPQEDPNSIDDKDAISVCVPSEDYYLGLKEYGSRGTKEIKKGEWDIVIFEVKKFIRMLKNGNPNVLTTLWLEPQHYIKTTEAGNLIIASRELFVGRHVYRSFSGYAYAQLHQMTKKSYSGYMGERRKALVDKFGYDTKNAAHLIRLLRMGIEFLKDGRLYVLRSDASQLLEIKRGEWSFEQVRTAADRLFKLAEEAYLKSTLPVQADKEKIDTLCVEVVKTALSERKF